MPKITPEDLGRRKHGGKIAALTAYDYPMARLLDEAGTDLLLVGDSLGMTVLGYADTTGVTMDDMLHHTRPVARAAARSCVAADLPIHSYDDPRSAVDNAQRLIDAGAQAVKLEGGQANLPQIRAIIAAGIPLLGHIGMLPQHVLEEGGYHLKGRTEEQRRFLLAEAEAVQAAGAFAVVLELILPAVAGEITELLTIPTIGIASGKQCDGQILVIHDLIGFSPWFTPRHVQAKAQIAREIQKAAASYLADLGTA